MGVAIELTRDASKLLQKGVSQPVAYAVQKYLRNKKMELLMMEENTYHYNTYTFWDGIYRNESLLDNLRFVGVIEPSETYLEEVLMKVLLEAREYRQIPIELVGTVEVVVKKVFHQYKGLAGARIPFSQFFATVWKRINTKNFLHRYIDKSGMSKYFLTKQQAEEVTGRVLLSSESGAVFVDRERYADFIYDEVVRMVKAVLRDVYKVPVGEPVSIRAELENRGALTVSDEVRDKAFSLGLVDVANRYYGDEGFSVWFDTEEDNFLIKINDMVWLLTDKVMYSPKNDFVAYHCESDEDMVETLLTNDMVKYLGLSEKNRYILMDFLCDVFDA